MITPTSLEEVNAAVSGCVDGRALRIAGRGTWMDAGAPVQSGDTLSLASYSGVVDYVPGDFTITVRAGTTLAEIATTTREHGQWLPLDPAGSTDGTIGATVATGSYGPLAAGFGRPRDQVLGMEFVSGSGETITVGSRVVKNVAGFDITRLLVGSWGTLGVITQITLRLRARSEVDRTAAVVIPDRGRVLASTLSAARMARIAPLALELLNPAVAGALGLPHETLLLARLGGNQESVEAQLAELGSLGAVIPAPDDCWERLQALDGTATSTFRLSTPLTDLQLVWDAVGDSDRSGFDLLRHATVTRGVIRCLVKSSTPEVPGALSARVRALESARLIPERLGPAWSAFAQSAADDPISRRVRQAFDPGRVLNRGILGEAR